LCAQENIRDNLQKWDIEKLSKLCSFYKTASSQREDLAGFRSSIVSYCRRLNDDKKGSLPFLLEPDGAFWPGQGDMTTKKDFKFIYNAMKEDLETSMNERIKSYQENSKKTVTPVIQNSIKSWWVKQKELETSALGQVQKEVKDYQN
jgi:hypothetical protein